MSFLSDIATLAKAGYSAQDVKELMGLNSNSSTDLSSDAQPTQLETEQAVNNISQSLPESPEADKLSETVPKESTQPESEPDYKALYEAEKAKVISLQNINNNSDVSGPGYDESELLKTIRTYC